MDKELNSIADDIIKDSFCSAAPVAPSPENAPARPPEAAPSPTPRETFTAEIPRENPPVASAMPVMGQANKTAQDKTNEYSRIKEQMSAAREASNIPNPEPIMSGQPMPKKHGLNMALVLFIILIPILVVAGGILIALLNQPSNQSSNSSSSTNNSSTNSSSTNNSNASNSSASGSSTTPQGTSEDTDTPADTDANTGTGASADQTESATGSDEDSVAPDTSTAEPVAPTSAGPALN